VAGTRALGGGCTSSWSPNVKRVGASACAVAHVVTQCSLDAGDDPVCARSAAGAFSSSNASPPAIARFCLSFIATPLSSAEAGTASAPTRTADSATH
jgi:hypothetical protein